METKRLNKFLAHAGIDSRRKVEELIITRRVKVNNEIIDEPGFQVDIEKDQVFVDGKEVKQETKQYFILNKPKGFVCSNVRKTRERLVIDIFKSHPYKLFTVGRLDRDTIGLVIVTNDGDLANKIIHPSSNIEKEYIAKVTAEVTHEELIKISKGAFVENRFVKPKKVFKVRKGTIKIIVKEGKKREVKAFIKKANLPLKELKRVRIGNLHLGKIPVGEYKKVSLKDLEAIFPK
ncbi:MAG: rRNA pseudouridine synthase [Parachlamydiales bacterium]|nr:rRNA pseudouridine synthase [Parachlamydiales bacterium]